MNDRKKFCKHWQTDYSFGQTKEQNNSAYSLHIVRILWSAQVL